jgi:hypothetical protein
MVMESWVGIRGQIANLAEALESAVVAFDSENVAEKVCYPIVPDNVHGLVRARVLLLTVRSHAPGNSP